MSRWVVSLLPEKHWLQYTAACPGQPAACVAWVVGARAAAQAPLGAQVPHSTLLDGDGVSCCSDTTLCLQWIRTHRTLNIVLASAGLIGIALGQALKSHGDAVSPSALYNVPCSAAICPFVNKAAL